MTAALFVFFLVCVCGGFTVGESVGRPYWSRRPLRARAPRRLRHRVGHRSGRILMYLSLLSLL